MGILVILAAVLFGFITWHSEESIRISGYVLQLSGMAFAIRGLLGIREHFGQPLLRQLFLQWLRRFPEWKRNVSISAEGSMLSISGMKGRLEVWIPDDPEKSIEQRIEGLVKNLDRIHDKLIEHDHAIDHIRDSHEEHKKQVAEEQVKMRKKIQSDLESLHTSDLITSLVGLVWLTVGITMSTLAPEFFKWLY